ncbi:uncharacterized protein LOC107782157 [Nicotiana tabacum]|uniref:uncharacterized protein LOC107782157 n=1 Tax=Nicotiana tabacum TaxID=4097 RepID=UPI003F4E685D
MHIEKWERLCDSKSRGDLGFRDLKAFNMALLAKQAWRILSYPDSLLTRVLKSKYFSHSTFLDASTSSTGSWIWRSILWGRDLLVTGLRWRISNGKNINVWTDPWIPRKNGFTPKSIQMQNNLDLKVADLIDEDTHTWKLHKISTTFEPEDIDAILSIPISIIGLNDRLLWHHSKSGNYEVKSGYYLAKGLAGKTIRNSEAQARSCHSFPKSFWDSLRNLEIKNKLKHFLRKCVINSLPVNYTLAKRLQNLDKTCKICGLESEDIEHMLFRCPQSQLVWKQSPINWPDIDNITDFSMWWYNLFLNAKHFPESTELLDLSVNLMWKIWKGRNAWCFNQEMLEPTEIVSKALFEYGKYKDLLTSCLAARHSTGNDFLPKLTNFHDDVLLFTDAGLRCDDRHANIGVATLNSLGKLLHAHGSSIQYVGKPMTAEAIAIRKALECAITLGWKSVKILSNAKNVVDMIQKQVATSWEIEVLCEEWKLSSMLDHVEFLYIPRKLNKVAHSLAKFSISLLKDISREKFFPTWVVQDAKGTFELCCSLMQ